MNRRGFLGAILAGGVAPFVMSNAIGRGVLMPVKELWTPALNVFYMAAGAVIKLYGGSCGSEDRLLATIPLENGALGGPRMPPQSVDAILSGEGLVSATGWMSYARIQLPGMPERPIDMNLNSRELIAGNTLHFPHIQLALG